MHMHLNKYSLRAIMVMQSSHSGDPHDGSLEGSHGHTGHVSVAPQCHGTDGRQC